ncbi:thiol-disulfide oxidoreductase ResA [Bacillus aquiflavi]|uniref:Thiol-disulfide oxidoreductase ResA n=1 Tax=Bacillus aquiflavi TaxID=2672567 RepID=A0A6B3VX69_9BACI|nr:thiol-disulfide oxidoreductase ResA [Bacillus aquiflavi]MBA4537315.1 thiol-disulfide oxidoreductase ResA [Bacillus aquiflavi]NEY81572.1 thiol-disulfide oxidoreductase ResA [Bacillus aquiflavi]
MKKKRFVIRTIILLVLAGAVVYTLYANQNKDKVDQVKIGSKAPDFILEDLEGNKHQLSDYEGQGVLLNFWGTFCKPCEKEMPFMDNQYKQFKDQGVQTIAVNVGESELSVKQFVKRHQLSFPVVIDKDDQAQDAYGVNPLPVTFLIDKDGTVVKMHTGELTEEMIKQFMEQIKP